MDVFEHRLFEAEKSIKELYYRMGNVEDEAKGAWNTIREVNKHMEEMDKRIDNLEKDVKDVKVNINKSNKTLKALVIVMSVLTVIVGGFFIYIWKHDAELAKSILTLGTTIGKLVA